MGPTVDVTHSEGNGKIERMTKRCRDCHGGQVDAICERCIDGQTCETPDLTDETMGIVHKNKGKVLKSHKYQWDSTSRELPIGVVALNGSESDGGESFEKIPEQIKSDAGPWLFEQPHHIEIYADGIYNSADNRERVARELGPHAELKSNPNPGNVLLVH